jgi:hypothetical protein
VTRNARTAAFLDMTSGAHQRCIGNPWQRDVAAYTGSVTALTCGNDVELVA